jgi:hypothetical protein
MAEKRWSQAKAPTRQIQLPLDRQGLLTLMQDSLETLTTELGQALSLGLVEDEMNRLCGQRYQRPGMFTRGMAIWRV